MGYELSPYKVHKIRSSYLFLTGCSDRLFRIQRTARLMQLGKDRSLYYHIYVYFYHGYERSSIDSHTDISIFEKALGSKGYLLGVEI